MAEILASPWEERLLTLAARARQTVRVAAPFVKTEAVAALLAQVSSGCEVSLITSFKLNYYHVGASDLAALEAFQLRAGTVLNHPPLHAKVYLFDDDQAIITSGNLTFGGLRRNTECGVWLQESILVGEVVALYQQWAEDERTDVLTTDDIRQSRQLLAKLPPYAKAREAGELSLEKATLPTDIARGKKPKQMYVMLEKLEALPAVFKLADLDVLLPEFQRLYPNNNTLDATFRSLLQDLRKVGLLEFLGNGRYRKLF